MTNSTDFHPAPRPMWVLYRDKEDITFALMPGWATVEDDDGLKWTTLTRQNPHNFEAEALDTDEHTLIQMWDSAVHGRPALQDVLAAVRTCRDATSEALQEAEEDYRMWFNLPARAKGDPATED